MKIEQINATTYANIYGVYDDSGAPVGTVEVKLAGRETGVYFYSLVGRYTKKDIKKFWKECRR